MSNKYSTWRQLILYEMAKHEESFDDVISQTIPDEQLDMVFDAGYGIEQGRPFTIWTKFRVYFPAMYDGSEWCASVSRNPNGLDTKHIGG